MWSSTTDLCIDNVQEHYICISPSVFLKNSVYVPFPEGKFYSMLIVDIGFPRLHHKQHNSSAERGREREGGRE